MAELPMFPLGVVLFPGMVLPLHVFEPRYRALMQDVIEAGREFGVTLIERGSEVGGGDVRTSIGTVATIVAAQQFPDGRWHLITVGDRRIRVLRWLDDAPYPRAEVEDFAEPADAAPPSEADYQRLVELCRQVLGLLGRLGHDVPDADLSFPDDAVLGTFQAASVSPLGALDRHKILQIPTAAERCSVLTSLLSDEAEFLTLRAAMNDDDE
ncbi:MAG: LON peptidase substrate-binding domain-containing protein [Acidimicrobiales bacterium]